MCTANHLRSRRHCWRAALTGQRAEPLSNLRATRAGPLLLFLRREHHDHLAPFHLRHLLDLADFLEIRAQTLEHPHTDFLVSHFTAAETQRDLRLVALFEEAHEIAELDVVIPVIGTRTELDFLDLDDLLLQLRFVLLLRLLVLELAVIHQTANRRHRLRRDLHQVNIQFFRFTESVSEFYDTERFVLDPDQAHFRRSDFTVDAVRRLISSDVTFPLKIKKTSRAARAVT
ncbi:hypothetical protein BCEN4_480099 [Burkholderia cenocepacia]|nr:hypothetical protein BCEN4_480099 [Burkholderia cenocepacia]